MRAGRFAAAVRTGLDRRPVRPATGSSRDADPPGPTFSFPPAPGYRQPLFVKALSAATPATGPRPEMGDHHAPDGSGVRVPIAADERGEARSANR